MSNTVKENFEKAYPTFSKYEVSRCQVNVDGEYEKCFCVSVYERGETFDEIVFLKDNFILQLTPDEVLTVGGRLVHFNTRRLDERDTL